MILIWRVNIPWIHTGLQTAMRNIETITWVWTFLMVAWFVFSVYNITYKRLHTRIHEFIGHFQFPCMIEFFKEIDMNRLFRQERTYRRQRSQSHNWSDDQRGGGKLIRFDHLIHLGNTISCSSDRSETLLYKLTE